MDEQAIPGDNEVENQEQEEEGKGEESSSNNEEEFTSDEEDGDANKSSTGQGTRETKFVTLGNNTINLSQIIKAKLCSIEMYATRERSDGNLNFVVAGVTDKRGNVTTLAPMQEYRIGETGAPVICIMHTFTVNAKRGTDPAISHFLPTRALRDNGKDKPLVDLVERWPTDIALVNAQLVNDASSLFNNIEAKTIVADCIRAYSAKPWECLSRVSHTRPAPRDSKSLRPRNVFPREEPPPEATPKPPPRREVKASHKAKPKKDASPSFLIPDRENLGKLTCPDLQKMCKAMYIPFSQKTPKAGLINSIMKKWEPPVADKASSKESASAVTIHLESDVSSNEESGNENPVIQFTHMPKSARASPKKKVAKNVRTEKEYDITESSDDDYNSAVIGAMAAAKKQQREREAKKKEKKKKLKAEMLAAIQALTAGGDTSSSSDEDEKAQLRALKQAEAHMSKKKKKSRPRDESSSSSSSEQEEFVRRFSKRDEKSRRVASDNSCAIMKFLSAENSFLEEKMLLKEKNAARLNMINSSCASIPDGNEYDDNYWRRHIKKQRKK